MHAEEPAAKWEHTHTFVPLGPETTDTREHIGCEEKSGVWALATRGLFSQPNLWFSSATAPG